MDNAYRAPVQETLGSIRVIDPVDPVDGAVPPGMLSEVIAARQVVRLTYVGKGEVGDAPPTTSTVRVVETMGLLRLGDARLVVGWCRLRQTIRDFRLERITGLEIPDEVAPPRGPALLEADLAQRPNHTLDG